MGVCERNRERVVGKGEGEGESKGKGKGGGKGVSARHPPCVVASLRLSSAW